MKGPDAFAFLERICANKIPQRDGGIVLGHLLNDNGFIESEITLRGSRPIIFYVLSAAVAQLYDMDQLNWRMKPGEKAHRRRCHRRFWRARARRPKARNVLSACTSADLSNSAFAG